MKTLYSLLRSIPFVLLFVLSSKVIAHQLTVHLPEQRLNLNYMVPARLSQVISDTQAQSKENLFFPAAILASHSKQEEVDVLRHSISKQLTRKDSDDSSKILNQLTDFQYVGREWVSTDFDELRLNPGLNPLLSGSYDLYVSPRKNTVEILGYVKNSESLPMASSQDLTHYLDSVEALTSGDLDELYIIHSDGTVIKTELGYWQPKRYYLSPGAKIFVGSKNNPNLNKEIAELLRYAVEKP
ncbi:conserved hypothetical protein [Vibrio nigripulchritudo SFn27]|uniref:Uncharacterized protein n=1 Tax=Vibrio nigripulchritudo TaxID=28173 RepID=U4KFP6_9VIBR|nr:capsule biosynthesis GfcC D2 domain-containing protein [Vibrio nigripulchritudo]CCN80357.1 conserved hypothetical protein [Vibrio nigripulchritudo BLFn1]CCN91281.1 conserved hypothetical protein [Vibrio nigripulchritudo SFn27]CCN92634.1 conserved hypothetical protein [Vibrio nigripulchritudo ENn2]CCO41038.1 conserved hypothetical protein [Vibrio nigripulchritudo SFn135]CCO50583.1 conserved hypothetical protein [Vibrio nigripulchritudo Wn13]